MEKSCHAECLLDATLGSSGRATVTTSFTMRRPAVAAKIPGPIHVATDSVRDKTGPEFAPLVVMPHALLHEFANLKHPVEVHFALWSSRNWSPQTFRQASMNSSVWLDTYLMPQRGVFLLFSILFF